MAAAELATPPTPRAREGRAALAVDMASPGEEPASEKPDEGEALGRPADTPAGGATGALSATGAKETARSAGALEKKADELATAGAIAGSAGVLAGMVSAGGAGAGGVVPVNGAKEKVGNGVLVAGGAAGALVAVGRGAGWEASVVAEDEKEKVGLVVTAGVAESEKSDEEEAANRLVAGLADGVVESVAAGAEKPEETAVVNALEDAGAAKPPVVGKVLVAGADANPPGGAKEKEGVDADAAVETGELNRDALGAVKVGAGDELTGGGALADGMDGNNEEEVPVANREADGVADGVVAGVVVGRLKGDWFCEKSEVVPVEKLNPPVVAAVDDGVKDMLAC